MAKVERPPANRFVALARHLYNPIGFSKGYNFVLWFICAGALLGFSLARAMYLDFDGIFCPENQDEAEALPGECFYYRDLRGHVGILLHLGAILPASILVFLQFLPVIRHKFLLFHRINGYVVIVASLAAMAGVIMIAEHSFGGSINIQVAIGMTTIIFVSCKAIAFWNIKRLQIEQHRAWMIRAWAVAGFIITMRVIAIVIQIVFDAIGPEGYYEARPCSVIDFMFSGNRTLVESIHPDCKAFYTGDDPDRHVLIDAFGSNGSGEVDQASAQLNLSFNAAAWLAVTIHIIAVELYLHLTPAEAARLRRVSYQRQYEAGMRRPGNAGLTAERLGDAEPFVPPPS